MPMTKYSIELTTRINEFGHRKYIASILAHRNNITTVADEAQFEDTEMLGEWVKDAVDAWC